jgi:hypothetical protein
MDRRWVSLVLAVSAAACSDIPVNHDTETRCGCVAEPVSLSPLGSPVETTTTVSPCRTFTLDVAAFADRPATSCKMAMTCPAQMGGGTVDTGPQVTGVNVAQAIAHPDVRDAVRTGPMRYGAGTDEPDGGGPVYRLGVGQVDFEVAGPCGSLPCTPIPAGVQELLRVMLAVNAQEVIRSPCREVLNL